MAVTGSTRMQASTAVMYILGLCVFLANDLIQHKTIDVIAEGKKQINSFHEFMQGVDLKLLKEYIEAESALYNEKNYIFYETTADYAISVLTDTTERCPTFSLYPFENVNDDDEYKKKRWPTEHTESHRIGAQRQERSKPGLGACVPL